MSQFASTLYPQTNPSNESLMAFREDCKHYTAPAEAAVAWLRYWEDLVQYGHTFQTASVARIEHTRRVLERLAALPG